MISYQSIQIDNVIYRMELDEESNMVDFAAMDDDGGKEVLCHLTERELKSLINCLISAHEQLD